MNSELKEYRFDNSTESIYKYNLDEDAYVFYFGYHYFRITGDDSYEDAVEKIEKREYCEI